MKTILSAFALLFITTSFSQAQTTPKLLAAVNDPNPVVLRGPYVHHIDGASVRVLWETSEAGSSILEFGNGERSQRVEDAAPKTKHAMTLTGLARGIEYTYTIKSAIDGAERSGGDFMFDSTFDEGLGEVPNLPSPFAQDALTPVYEAAAERIAGRMDARKGYCLVWGFGEGRLAYEIAKRTRLKVIGIEEDPAKIATARRLLRQAGVYGDRISVQRGSLSDLPYGKYFASLIVSDQLVATGRIGGSAAEMLRVLRPCGGVMQLGQPSGAPSPMDRSVLENWLNTGGIEGYTVTEGADGLWIETVREPLADTGEWTHLYAEPGNSSCSQDQLIAHPLRMLWYGRPGPRLMINRHSRPMSSLYKHGRIFIPADDRIIAVDAYNGTRLWDLSVPGSRRLGAFKGSAQMAVTDDYVYIAQGGQCHAVDVVGGLPAFSLDAPQLVSGEMRDWGYIACVGDRVFATAHKIGTPFYEYTANGNCDVLEGDKRVSMVSDYIFSQNRHTGETAWTYHVGAILEGSIAIGEGRVYFAENRDLPSPTGRYEGPGRRWVKNFTSGGNTYLVALDAQSGDKVWERQVELPFSEMMYLSYADDTVLTVGSYYQGGKCYYGLFAFDAGTGQPKWEQSHDSGYGTGGSHGEQWQHTVVVGDRVFCRPYDYDLHTGEKGSFDLKKGGGCGTYSASSEYLFARDSNPSFYKFDTRLREKGPLSRVTRPGCFINIIPAGGMVLIPESSSGCTCEYSVQTSLAYVAE